MPTSSRRRSFVAGFLASAVLTAGAAHALEGDETREIAACRHRTTGALRAVDDSSACTTQETPLSWNRHGATGPAGPQGPAGAQGASGMSQVYAAEVGTFALTPQFSPVASVNLPAGNYVLTATAYLQNLSGAATAPVNCYLNGQRFGELLAPFRSGNEGRYSATLSLTEVVTNHPGGPRRFVCQNNVGSGEGDARLENVRLTAIRVDQLEISRG